MPILVWLWLFLLFILIFVSLLSKKNRLCVKYKKKSIWVRIEKSTGKIQQDHVDSVHSVTIIVINLSKCNAKVAHNRKYYWYLFRIYDECITQLYGQYITYWVEFSPIPGAADSIRILGWKSDFLDQNLKLEAFRRERRPSQNTMTAEIWNFFVIFTELLTTTLNSFHIGAY